jgi:hypothetical protein
MILQIIIILLHNQELLLADIPHDWNGNTVNHN